MTEAEWTKITAVMTANWPHQLPPPESLAKWGRDLAELPGPEVLAAVEAIYRDGKEFPPNGGQIRNKVLELRLGGEPGFEDAYALAIHAASSKGYEAGLDWLRERAPLVAAAAERYPWREFCLSKSADTTRRAQFKAIFEAMREKAEKGERYAGLPAPRPQRLAPRPMRELVADVAGELGPGEEKAA